jgi:toxin ParE1/3/4
MVDHKVIWSARSLHDLDRSFDIIAEKSLQSANRAVHAVLEKVTQLEKFPESGPLEPSLTHRKKAYRYLVCNHHKIIYRIEQRTVFIVRLFDTRQHPNKIQ